LGRTTSQNTTAATVVAAARPAIVARMPSASTSAGVAAIPAAMPRNIPIVPRPVASAPCSSLNQFATSFEMPLRR
jgi:hypothetical protein